MITLGAFVLLGFRGSELELPSYWHRTTTSISVPGEDLPVKQRWGQGPFVIDDTGSYVFGGGYVYGPTYRWNLDSGDRRDIVVWGR